jgi:CBS domain-containing protein
VICPSCGHDNIAGVDECSRCEAALAQEDLPQPTTAVKRSIMTDPISALGLPPAECVPLGTPISVAISRMKAVDKGYLCVVRPDGTLAGLFTERDVAQRVAGQITDLEAMPVDELMTERATVLHPSAPIAHGLHIMAVHGFRHVPVTDAEGRPESILSSRRIVEYIQEIA